MWGLKIGMLPNLILINGPPGIINHEVYNSQMEKRGSGDQKGLDQALFLF